VNLPFIVWQPAAWLHGTLLPFFGGLVAGGQGLVTLATHGLSGGLSLTMLSVAALLAYITVMAAWVVWYPALKRVWLLLMPVVFFFAPRSLSSYLVDLFPVAVVARAVPSWQEGATAAPAGDRRRRHECPRLLGASAFHKGGRRADGTGRPAPRGVDRDRAELDRVVGASSLHGGHGSGDGWLLDLGTRARSGARRAPIGHADPGCPGFHQRPPARGTMARGGLHSQPRHAQHLRFANLGW